MIVLNMWLPPLTSVTAASPCARSAASRYTDKTPAVSAETRLQRVSLIISAAMLTTSGGAA